MSKQFLRNGVLCAVVAAVPFALHAQTTDGSIYGAVSDPTGAAIPGAQIVVTDIHTNVTLTDVSNGKGEYLFPTVLPGDYTVKVTAAGFKAQVQTGVTVQANSNIHVPVALTIGAAEETVSVEAGVTLVDTREAQVSATIDQARVENLPTQDRNAYALLTTIPGVSNFGGDNQTGTRGGATLSVNGLPTDQSSFYLDGAYDTNFYGPGGNKAPNPDALDQFHVITSNFDAEFGRSPGAVINMISKRGGNQYHGSAYEYFRNDAIDAKGFFNTTKPLLRQNQFGATFGGFVPGLRDKLFFFGSYEHLQIHQTALQNSQQTFTALQRTGNFTGATILPKLPATEVKNGVTVQVQCGTTAAPIICPAALDPVAQSLLQFIPVFTGTGTQQESAPSNINNDEGLGRIDYHGFSRHEIYGTFFRTEGLVLDPGAGGNGGLGIAGVLPQYSGMTEFERQQNAILADDWTISSRTVNSIRGFYTDNRYIIRNELGTANFASSLGSGQPQGSAITSPTSYSVTGDFTLGPNGAGPSDINQISFGLIDTATLQLGHHAVKVGAAYISDKYSETGKGNSNGNYVFNSSGLTGAPLADFLIGYATTLNQNSGVFHRTHNQDPAAFVQDDWQVTRRFNLNLGIRWELVQPWLGDNSESDVQEGVQSTVAPGAPLGLLVVGDKGIQDGSFQTSYNRFAPRVGFADDVYGDGRTSIRGAFGIFYEQIEEPTIGGQVQEPYTVAQQINGVTSLQCPYGGTFAGGTCAGSNSPFPYQYSPGKAKYFSNTTLSAFRPGEKSTPYAEEYNLQVQQQISKSTAITIGYVAMNYMKQYIQLDINTPQYFPGANVTENIYAAPTAALPSGNNGLNCRRPYEPYRVGGIVNSNNCVFLKAAQGGYTDSNPVGLPLQFGAINEYFPANNNHYNSLQTQINGHMKNFDYNANYVWGKTLNFTTPTVDQSDIRKNYGPADVDVRNRFAFSGTFHLPDVHRFGFVGSEILSGWRLNDITILQSGGPTTIMANVDVNRDGNTNDRVNIVGDRYTHIKDHVALVYGAGYLKASSYSQPCGATVDPTCTYPYGNEQRDSIVTPNNYNSNLSAFKEFALPREVRFVFRAEAFNAFNYTHLTSIRNNLTVFPTAINKFQTADQGRVLQFAGKILF